MLDIRKFLVRVFASAAVIASTSVSQGDIIAFQASDFGVVPIFSDVRTFQFSINMAGPIVAGTAYVNPTLNSVVYSVSGSLTTTPSGFPAFDLVRTIGGAEFYSQGSSLSFTVSANANLSDGLQASELTGSDPVFVFNGREVNTGRYHPALFQLNSNGTGSIRNSNNFGGINPSSGQVVNVDFGAEYITNLTFAPASLTLVNSVSVPEPGSLSCLFATGLWLAGRRRRVGS